MSACRVLWHGVGWRARLGGLLALLVLVAAATGFPPGAAAEQASEPGSPAAAGLDVSGGTDTDPSGHTCAVQGGGEVRCWGYGFGGRLGYPQAVTPANLSIGDDEAPGAVGPVELGGSATAISAGAFHNCALLQGGSVRCWGFGGEGRLGYRNVATIGDDEPPGSVGPVDLGASATAISAGGGHSCAVLVGGVVRCWGFGGDGRLGYGVRADVGDNETPASVGPVDLGADRTATAITAGRDHTCALLNGGDVRCWGLGVLGRLGYASETTIGDDDTPGAVGPVELGGSARAISAGHGHTCALLDVGSVRCWGHGANGRLGYPDGVSPANPNIGDDESPASFGPVVLGGAAKAISAGDAHTCALLVDGSVRCWGHGANGRLGYASTEDVGDDETPAGAGAVYLGENRTAVAISAGGRHTCARLDDGSVRCWGAGFAGRLGYCNELDIGDDEAPGSVGPVNLSTAVSCAAAGAAPPGPPAPAPASPAPAAPAPPAPAPPAAAGPFTAKLSLARARIVRRDRMLDVLAPITRLASGRARVQLHASGLLHSFNVSINQRDARIRFRKLIPKAQAQLGTGILTITYRGDADTRPQTVRLRAASQPANLRLTRPTISQGRLRAAGTVSKRARGVVRVQIQYVVAGNTSVLEFKAGIANGRWSLNEQLSRTVRTAIAQRTGTVHSYTQFTGYYQRRVRGEMRSYRVLGPR